MIFIGMALCITLVVVVYAFAVDAVAVMLGYDGKDDRNVK